MKIIPPRIVNRNTRMDKQAVMKNLKSKRSITETLLIPTKTPEPSRFKIRWTFSIGVLVLTWHWHGDKGWNLKMWWLAASIFGIDILWRIFSGHFWGCQSNSSWWPLLRASVIFRRENWFLQIFPAILRFSRASLGSYQVLPTCRFRFNGIMNLNVGACQLWLAEKIIGAKPHYYVSAWTELVQRCSSRGIPLLTDVFKQ